MTLSFLGFIKMLNALRDFGKGKKA